MASVCAAIVKVRTRSKGLSRIAKASANQLLRKRFWKLSLMSESRKLELRRRDFCVAVHQAEASSFELWLRWPWKTCARTCQVQMPIDRHVWTAKLYMRKSPTRHDAH